MKQTNFSRTVSVILGTVLLLLTMLSALSGCGQKPDDTTSTTTTGTQGDAATTANTATDTEAVTTTAPSHGIPELDYTGKTVTILGWKDADFDEFNADTQTGDLFNDAKYTRNLKIEEEFGVDLIYDRSINGNVDNAGTFISHITNSLNADAHDFDIIAGYSQTMCTLSSTGMLYNLLDTAYLDFETAWWPQNMLEVFTIANKLCICSGDIAPTTLYMLYGMFYNKDMIEEFKLEDPHQLVVNNQWTQEKFFELCAGTYADLNGDAQKNLGDRFGYMTGTLHLDPWFYSIGAKIVENDESGSLIISPTLTSEKTVSTIEALQKLLFASSDALLSDNVASATPTFHLEAFAANQVLFTTEAAYRAIQYFNTEGLTYGVLPMPKYNAEQEEFVSLLRNTVTLFAIPFNTKDPDMISAIMQAYAFYGKQEIVPAVFEQTLKLKYSDTELDAQMYDIIRSSLTFDIGRFYAKVLIGQGDFRTSVSQNTGGWASKMRALEKPLTKSLSTLEEAFSNMK